MGRLIIGNAFSLSMLPSDRMDGTVYVRVRKLTASEAQRLIKSTTKEIECAIGHQSTAQLASQLLETELNCERKMIQLAPEDTLLVVQLAFRAPEGKIYTLEELRQLLNEGKIAIYEVQYEPPPALNQ